MGYILTMEIKYKILLFTLLKLKRTHQCKDILIMD